MDFTDVVDGSHRTINVSRYSQSVMLFPEARPRNDHCKKEPAKKEELQIVAWMSKMSEFES